MFQGTGSDVGKSTLVAGLCRALTQRGLRVRPFKSQNMSNNAAVTGDGGEIGRAQALQARACGIAPSVHMNPVLLKPEGELGAQVVVQGQRLRRSQARDFARLKPDLMAAALESYAKLGDGADIILIEGAGSAAEVNLRDGEIANMGFAEATGVPVVLIGDIDRGGVIANLVGTQMVLSQDDRARVAGYIINKFRGDVSLFDDGLAAITRQTGWPSFGVVPWFNDAHRLPAEDSVGIADRARVSYAAAPIRIAVPLFPRIANHDDLDPLAVEPDVTLTLIEPGSPLPGDADLIILPGSKATCSDLDVVRANGWDIDLAGHLRRGGAVLGLCGGYQMLGGSIDDPDGIEGRRGRVDGLGLLEVATRLTEEKKLVEVHGRHHASSAAVHGYEMHIGVTEGPARERPFVVLDDGAGGRAEGAISADGKVAGTYVHGLFASDAFRHAFLSSLRARAVSGAAYEAGIEQVLDALAAHVEATVDVGALLSLAKGRVTT
ncbi:MAG: cobyric acid synthase [Pseudomonadota bacterium]